MGFFIAEAVWGPFRAYSRQALRAVGGFNEQLESHAESDLALRVAAQGGAELVPEMLYARRINTQHQAQRSPRATVQGFARKLLAGFRLLRIKRTLCLQGKEYRAASLLIPFLYHSLDVHGIRSGLVRVLRLMKNAPSSFLRKHLFGVLEWVCGSFISRMSWWPAGPSCAPEIHRSGSAKRFAYYMWHFPALSETFLHRELAALRACGLDVTILAEESENIEMADENARQLLEYTQYLYPLDEHRVRRCKRRFFLSHPLVFLTSFLYLVTRQYRERKNISDDAYVFSKAVYLAGVLRDRGIDHVHTPWADETALVAQVASRLAGSTYSVQARAHDIHRRSYQYGLLDKFRGAKFVVTNTLYNRAHLQELFDQSDPAKLVLIYNGLDLDEFVPPRTHKVENSKLKVLCVARLIEQKGLVYLLKACRILLDKGLDFHCEIVGAPEEPLYTTYFVQLKLLHRRLTLEHHVVFSGAQPFSGVLARYAASDIFVLPCVIAEDGSRDVTPNSLIEAMAMEMPVVSTTVTGVPEIVEDGVSGILVPPRDEEALADALSRLLRDRGLRERLGANARKKVEAKFQVNRNILRYVDLFTDRPDHA
jgi:glycosyltransferase involved in cell wall biosynthesis